MIVILAFLFNIFRTAASELMRQQPSSHRQSAVGDAMREEIAGQIAESREARQREVAKLAQRQQHLNALERDLHIQIDRAVLFTEAEMQRRDSDSLRVLYQQRVLDILEPRVSEEPDVRKLKLRMSEQLRQQWLEEDGAKNEAQKKEEAAIEKRREFLRQQHNKLLTSKKAAKLMSQQQYASLIIDEQERRERAEQARLAIIAEQRRAKYYKDLMEQQAKRNYVDEENKKRYAEALARIEEEKLEEEQNKIMAEYARINAQNQLESELAGAIQ